MILPIQRGFRKNAYCVQLEIPDTSQSGRPWISRPQNLLYLQNYLLHLKNILYDLIAIVYVYTTMFVHSTFGVCIK